MLPYGSADKLSKRAKNEKLHKHWHCALCRFRL
jgi:hypothetical protein